MKSLTEIFNIKKGDVVSIVGSGGKTSLLYKLSEELRNEYRVMVSTSARILMPTSGCYDFLHEDIESYFRSKPNNLNGVTVVAKKINRDSNKLMGIGNEDLDKLLPHFDIVLLEADGSKKLPIKGWKSHEPPVLIKTTKSIGVFPANFINKEVKQDFIYGFDEFNILTDNSEYINFETMAKICFNKNGLFKNSMGSLYLFLNKADTHEVAAVCEELSDYLNNQMVNKTIKFKVCFGSLKNGVYYEC